MSAKTTAADARSQRELARHIAALCTRIGARMIGTPGDHASAAYVESQFERFGLSVISSRMRCHGWDLRSTLLRVDGRQFRAVGNMYSPAGRAKGRLVLSEPDIPDRAFAEHAGRAVAVYGDFNPFPARLNAFARNAERAGAVCLIVIDTNHSTSSTKLVRELRLERMPVVSVSLETGFRLAKREGGLVECRVDARRYSSETRDVIGILEGGPREICIEAHRDTAPDTPGADDNGSGSVVLLELARLLSACRLRHSVRFVSATAEEFGDVGTPVYARRFAAELKRIDLMINLDCVGGLLCPLKVYVHRGDPVVPLARRMLVPYGSMKLVLTEDRSGGHIRNFLPKRVNAVNVICDWTNALIHTPRDEPSNLSCAKMADVAHYIRDLIVAYDRKGLR
jgi:Iap family predicted aminopeptidase